MPTIDTVMETKYANRAHILFNQMESKLYNSVNLIRQESGNAESMQFDKFDASGSARINPQRNAIQDPTADNVDKVTCTTKTFMERVAISVYDINKVNFNYLETQMKVVNSRIWKAVDDELLAVVNAAAPATTTLPTANIFNYSGATVVANELFDSYAMEISDEVHAVLPTMGYTHLLNDTNAINNYHAYNDAVRTGQMQNVAGFSSLNRFQRCPAVSGQSQKYGFAWNKMAIGGFQVRPYETRYEWSVERNSWLITGLIQVGFVVIDLTGVRRVAVKNSLT